MHTTSRFCKAALLCTLFAGLALSVTGQGRPQAYLGQQPLYLLDSTIIDLRHLVLSPENIESIRVLKDSNAIAVYGEKARYGAVIMKAKPGVKLLRVDEVFMRFKVRQRNRHLRVCIDKTLMSSPEQLLIDEGAVLGVEITTDRNWSHAEDAKSNERLINIKTNLAAKKKA